MKENSLVAEASVIAQSMYEAADAVEESSDEEKWRTVSKLKNAANDAYFYVAQVSGAGKNKAIEFDCIYARKNLNALKSMYLFASKTGLIKLDPNEVIRIDKLIIRIDTELESSQNETKLKTEEDLKPWLEKYQIWKKISKD